LEQTGQLNNLFDESSHKHLQNFPQKSYLAIKTLYVDLAFHMALLQSSQTQQNTQQHKTLKEREEDGERKDEKIQHSTR
jgi:hypothetical protein